MLGLTLFMLDNTRKDADQALDLGFSNYINSGWKHLATRVTVLQAEIFRSRGMFREAAGAFLRASSVEVGASGSPAPGACSDFVSWWAGSGLLCVYAHSPRCCQNDDLRAALLIEQSALCFLTQPVAHHRKFAFHSVLAGHRFSNAKQRRHALRCYLLASTWYARACVFVR